MDGSVVSLYKAAKSASQALKDMINMLKNYDALHEVAHDVAFANEVYHCDPALHQLHSDLLRKRGELGQANARLEASMERMQKELQDADSDFGF